MLKHAIIDHPGEDMSVVKFGMKIVRYCQTSFERQILESVLIQSERKHHNILNSRSEYNRCSLPRLTTKMGEDSYKEFGKEIENEKNEEIKIEKKIRELRKIKNKARLHPTKEIGSKRRKINEENKYITINEIWGKPTISTQMKNKHENQNENIPSKKLRIICWEDLEKETTTNYNKILKNHKTSTKLKFRNKKNLKKQPSRKNTMKRLKKQTIQKIRKTKLTHYPGNFWNCVKNTWKKTTLLGRKEN